MDQRCTEKREHQVGEFYSRKRNEDNGERWSRFQFEGGNVWIGGELIDGGWKPAWKRLKEKLKKGVKNQRVEEFKTKEQQSKLYRGQEQECHLWLSQILNPGKKAAIMTMLVQIVETRSWK